MCFGSAWVSKPWQAAAPLGLLCAIWLFCVRSENAHQKFLEIGRHSQKHHMMDTVEDCGSSCTMFRDSLIRCWSKDQSQQSQTPSMFHHDTKICHNTWCAWYFVFSSQVLSVSSKGKTNTEYDVNIYKLVLVLSKDDQAENTMSWYWSCFASQPEKKFPHPFCGWCGMSLQLQAWLSEENTNTKSEKQPDIKTSPSNSRDPRVSHLRRRLGVSCLWKNAIHKNVFDKPLSENTISVLEPESLGSPCKTHFHFQVWIFISKESPVRITFIETGKHRGAILGSDEACLGAQCHFRPPDAKEFFSQVLRFFSRYRCLRWK